MSTATATAAAKQSIETALTAVDICRKVQALLSGLSSQEQEKITAFLQPIPLTDGNEKEVQLAKCQRALSALLLDACSGDDEWVLEVFQASRSCKVELLFIFLRRFLLSERCRRRHVCRYLSFCCEHLDTPGVYRALMTGVYVSFLPALRTEIMYVAQVHAYLRRDTIFATPLST